MGLNLSNKLINTDTIKCDETFFVTLALSASPDIQENPVDIVLMLDRSGSMLGLPLAEVKIAAKKFVDIIDEATNNGVATGTIAGGSRIGIVSFAGTATKDALLTTDVATLKTAIDNITSSSLTNHADAFTKCMELFDPLSPNKKVMIMFTDGKTTVGGNANIQASIAKALGITIYCIGLLGSGGIDISALNDWASDPDSSYVFIVPTPQDLETIFEELAANISKTGATNIVIDEVLNPLFNIVNLTPPNKGNASLINPTTIKWTIDELGKSSLESATLIFEVKYTGESSIITNVNDSITYTDNENNVANFQNPEITINCEQIFEVNPCPEPQVIDFDPYVDYLEYSLDDYTIENLGRVLSLNLTLKNVMPNRKVAVAITLNELIGESTEIKKATKFITVPMHNNSTCEDVKLTDIVFVLPEEDGDGLCEGKRYTARVFANYIDFSTIC